MAPSDYFKRQVFVSVEPDEAGVKYVIDYLGTDRLIFSTDYPHGDSKFPHAVESFLNLDITRDDKRKILWDNCAEFYHVGQHSSRTQREFSDGRSEGRGSTR